MNTLNLLQWALVCIGCIYFVTQSVFFGPFRRVLANLPVVGDHIALLIYCPSCVGFWVGIAVQHWLWSWAPVGFGWRPNIESGLAAMALGTVWSWRVTPAIIATMRKELQREN